MTFCTHSRKLLPGLACALFILYLNGAQPAPSVKTASPTAPTTLQGAAALEQLKQTGQYTSLQAAMKQARFTVSHASQTPLGHAAWHAPNRAAGYDAYVHEDGVSLVLADARPVSLQLCGLGYGADLHDVAAGTVSGAQQTINVDRGAVREWYVNSAEGLEQGFTLNAPPAGEKQPGAKLRLALQLSAGWRAVPSADAQRVSLLNEPGAMLEYGKLAAWDAQGQILPATLAVEHERIVIEVDDTQAVYPLTIDPIFSQQAKLSAPDAAAGDSFGFTVALDGNTAAVGAPFDDVSGADQGSVYVFVRNGTVWTFQAKLVAVDGIAGDQFGFAFALSSDTLVIGAHTDDIGANNDQGSAYVFTRSGTSWSQQQKLTASDGAPGDFFGSGVALDGDTAVVGAPLDDIGANADQGSAYVFTRNGTTWTQQQRLIANDGAAGDNFGYVDAVALDGDTALLGAPFDNTRQGSAYVFTRGGMVWTQQQKLMANDGATFDQFGRAVALSGDTVLVGADNDAINANNSQGSAYVFTRTGVTWTQQPKLTASDGAASDAFGGAVALSGDTAVIGATLDSTHLTSQHGAAYVFARNGTAWTQQRKLLAADGKANDRLGRHLALSGDTILVGAYQADGAFSNQGAAYVFVLCDNNFTQQQQLLASDGAVSDQFGQAVALSGETAVVGVLFDDIGANANQGSVYVFTRSGAVWSQQQKLTAGDGAAQDTFGATVTLSGDTIVVGVPSDDIGANSDQGSAYVFTRSGTLWTQQQRLTAGDGAANDFFGSAVTFSGDTAVVGAPSHEVGAITNQGAAYVFTRSGTVWTQQQILTANDAAAGDNLGCSVALSGDTVLAGARFDDVGANSDQGSAYVFTRSGTSWSQQQKLMAGDGAESDDFGVTVALSGDTAVVGASNDDISANNDQGSAYVFARSGAVWSQQQKLTASDGAASDFFGSAVALSGDTAVVGASNDDVGMNSNQGSAYVFTRSGTLWSQQQKLTASDGMAVDVFGFAVALSGDTVVVGTLGDDIGANGNQGSAYVFVCPACPAITLGPTK